MLYIATNIVVVVVTVLIFSAEIDN